MVNTQLFQTLKGQLLPQATAQNQAGAPAYALSPQHQLAQIAATGCLSQTFYADAQSQLDAVQALAAQVEPSFVAQTAVYARQTAFMKDMPVLLASMLAVSDVALLSQVFGRVVDNGKTLRGFVQMLRSGALGRKSLGSRPKKLVQQWLLNASEKQLLNAAVGNTPSLADLVKMVHPKPTEAWRAAWFAWLIGKPFDEAALTKELGINYVHVPLGGPDTPYTPEAVEKVADAIAKADGDVLLHCTVGWRASPMWAADLVKHKGLSEEEAIKQASAINFGGYTPPNGGPLPIDGLLGRAGAPAVNP